VIFVVSFHAPVQVIDAEEEELPTVPGTFCLGYLARVVTAGSYAWQPAVARQAFSPGLVAITRPAVVELR
jgi:uncharacterized protein YfaS (alpha-2-macroglobulin family)